MNTNPEITFSTRIRKSPFFDSTLKWGCKGFTVYNKMYMPTFYNTFVDDYWSLVNDVTLWDVAGQRQIEITGKDAERFIEFLTPRDISKCKIGQCMYVILTEKNGGIVNDPVLLKLSENHYWLSIADSDVLLWCLGVASGHKFEVNLCEADVSPLALQGPKSPLLMEKILGVWIRELKFFYFKKTNINEIPVIIARSGWSGEAGYEIYLMDSSRGNELWEIIMEAGNEFNIAPAAPNQINRIECGMLSYGSDMTLDENPYDISMEKIVHLEKKAEFLSKEALINIYKKKPSKKLIGIEIPHSNNLDYNPEHIPVYIKEKIIGKITSSVFSPRLKKNIALGIIENKSYKNEIFYIKNHNDKIRIKICNLPFLRKK